MHFARDDCRQNAFLESSNVNLDRLALRKDELVENVAWWAALFADEVEFIVELLAILPGCELGQIFSANKFEDHV